MYLMHIRHIIICTYIIFVLINIDKQFMPFKKLENVIQVPTYFYVQLNNIVGTLVYINNQ